MGICDKLRRKYISSFGLKKNWFIDVTFSAMSSDFDTPVELDVFTVSFNNSMVIEYQINLFRKYVEGNYRLIVVDNSNNPKSADEIKNICQKYNISYIKIERKIYLHDPSFSHGVALNWIYYNLIEKRKNNFAFIDHDIFPFKKICITDCLKDEQIYGKVDSRNNGDLWYLWPGFCFYKYEFLSKYKVDFLPCKRMDTGGSNYHNIYKFLDLGKIKKAVIKKVKMFETSDKNAENAFQKCFVEYIDGCWLHSNSASNWTDNDNKNEKIYKILDDYLK